VDTRGLLPHGTSPDGRHIDGSNVGGIHKAPVWFDIEAGDRMDKLQRIRKRLKKSLSMFDRTIALLSQDGRHCRKIVPVDKQIKVFCGAEEGIVIELVSQRRTANRDAGYAVAIERLHDGAQLACQKQIASRRLPRGLFEMSVKKGWECVDTGGILEPWIQEGKHPVGGGGIEE
jgi:hypothetical protein